MCSFKCAVYSVQFKVCSLQYAVEQVPGLDMAGPAQYRPIGLGNSEDWLGIEGQIQKEESVSRLPYQGFFVPQAC